MKRILITSNIILIFGILILACRNRGERQDSPVADTTSRVASSLSPVHIPGMRTEWDAAIMEAGVENPSELGFINYDLADSMSKLYRLDANKASYRQMERSGEVYLYLTQKDATSIWFSLDAIEEFLMKIKNCNPKRDGIYNPRKGIRIYYAKYPDNMAPFTGLGGLAPNVRNKHTLFMVPTYQDTVAGINVDFNTNYLGTDSSRPLPYYMMPAEAKRTASILVFNNPFIWLDAEDIRTRRILNHGGLSPPPDSSGGFPTPGADY
jgi:hypothetical protein